MLEEEDDRETLEMSQVVWDTDHADGDNDSEAGDNWDDLDKTLMEDFAKNLTSTDTSDIGCTPVYSKIFESNETIPNENIANDFK